MTNLANRPPLGQKAKRVVDRKRLAAVKMLPCVICGAPPPSDAHHCICGRFSTQKAGDDMTIPLCKFCHQWGPDAIHNGKETWVAKYGPDTNYLEEANRLLREAEDDILGDWF